MHTAPNTRSLVASPSEELGQEMHARTLEKALATLEDFLSQESYTSISAIEPVYRAAGATQKDVVARIKTAQYCVANGDMENADELAEIGYEPTLLIPLAEVSKKSGFMVFLFEGQVSKEKGYGVIDINSQLSTAEMEAFMKPRDLLHAYKERLSGGVILRVAEAILNRKKLLEPTLS